MSVSVCICIVECRCPQRLKALDSPVAGVTNGYEPLDTGTEAELVSFERAECTLNH